MIQFHQNYIVVLLEGFVNRFYDRTCNVVLADSGIAVVDFADFVGLIWVD
jgi:hypothetical protein